MRLQLDSTGIQGTQSPYGADALSSRPAGSRQRSGADSVGLTGISRVLQSDQAARSSRLEALTAAVRSGTYSVSSAKVATALVSGGSE